MVTFSNFGNANRITRFASFQTDGALFVLDVLLSPEGQE
jgi:hypothetical protein